MALGAFTLSASGVQPFPRPDFSRPDGEPVVDVAGAVRALWPEAVPPQERVWRKIYSNTAVTGITRDTVRIETCGGPLTGIETPEESRGSLRLLARAAGEGIERGYEYFEISHLRDRNYASAGRLFPDFLHESRVRPGAGHAGPLYAGLQRPIGSYAELAASRYERAKTTKSRAAAPRAWAHPGLTAVIEYTNEAPSRYRERFEAGAVYRNLVSDGGLE